VLCTCSVCFFLRVVSLVLILAFYFFVSPEEKMSDKKVVLIGAGRLGNLIIDNLLKHGASVRVLARDPKKIAARAGVEAVQFDAEKSSEAEAVAAFKGQGCVLCHLVSARRKGNHR
jgi:glutamyl-tRNA reductase